MSEFIRDIDFTRYLRPPLADVAGTVALAIALLSATDRRFPAPVRREAKALRAAVLKLQDAWAEQQKSARAPRVDPRASDGRVDRAWGAMAGILQSLASLPGTLPEAQTATRLYETIFPTGQRFLTFPFGKQWAESEQKLRAIEADGLADELVSLVGEVVLNEVREAHAEYGRVLGITDSEGEARLPVNLVDTLRTTRTKMASYALQVIAAAQADEDLVGLAKVALRPFDTVREGQARRAAARARNGMVVEETDSEDPEAIDDVAEPGSNVVEPSPGELDVGVSPLTPVPELDDASG